MAWLAYSLIFAIYFLNVHAQKETSTTSINLTETDDYIDTLTTLEANLLRNYNRMQRPVKNDATRTIVRFFAVINHIEELDEMEQAMTVHGFLLWEWKDEYMIWDKSDYNGVDRISLHPWYLWKPDIVLYNTGAGMEGYRQISQGQHIWAHQSGSITYFPFFSFRATCMFNFDDYPNDVQICPLIMGSWSYTMGEMEIIPFTSKPGVKMAWFGNKTIVSGWEMVDTKMDITYWNAQNKIRMDVRPNASEFYQSFTEINVWLTLKRYAPYFGLAVLAPAVMTSLFTLASFWTVSTSHAIAVLLVNLIMQAVFTDDLLHKMPPSTGGIARIARYYAFNFTCTVVCIILFMILKFLETMHEDTKRAVPSPLASMVQSGDSMQGALSRRLGFKRHLDEEHNMDDEEDEANRQKPTTSAQPRVATWLGVADILKKISFIIFIIIYLIFIFTWLS